MAKAFRPYKFKSQTTAVVVGSVFLVAGWYCFRDAYNRRNQKPPLPLRLVGVTGPA
jgi:hypothetical protein